MTKAPTPMEKPKKQCDNTQTPAKNFDYTRTNLNAVDQNFDKILSINISQLEIFLILFFITKLKFDFCISRMHFHHLSIKLLHFWSNNDLLDIKT